MEVRKGFKQTDAGVIPEDWEVNTLRELTTLLTNGFVGTATTQYTNANDGVLYIQGFNVEENSFNLTGIKRVNKEFHNRHSKSRLQEGDLLTIQTGDVGLTTIVPKEFEGANCHALIISRFKKQKAFPKFYSQYFNSAYCRQRLKNIETGTTMKHLNVTDMLEFQVVVPSPLEQQAIATALSDVDALLNSLEALIAKKRLIKQGAMQELMTGKKRLLGFSGEWEIVKFDDLADKNVKWSITGGPFGSNLKASDYVPEGVRIIQLQNIGDGVFHDDYAIYTSEQKANELVSCNIYPGEIILSKMGDPVARACLVPMKDKRYLMASDGIRLVVDAKRFDKRFVFYYINSIYFRRKAIEASTGSTRQRIGLTDLRNLPFVAPTLPEQTAIAEILSDMDAEISALEQKREKTRLLKQGMMQELLTGRIRLV